MDQDMCYFDAEAGKPFRKEKKSFLWTRVNTVSLQLNPQEERRWHLTPDGEYYVHMMPYNS
jgi:hypothetical protein